MAEENSQSDILSEENGAKEVPILVEGIAELSLSPQKEEDDGKGNNYAIHELYSLTNGVYQSNICSTDTSRRC